MRYLSVTITWARIERALDALKEAKNADAE